MASGHVNRANRPNTWLHRPRLQREDSPCQLGAVHTWHKADIDVRGAPSRNRRRAATPAIGPSGAVAEAGFAIALAAMLSERPVHGTGIQSGAQHDGRTDTMRIAVIGAGGGGGACRGAL